jgi:hypothetical protein
MTMYEPLDRSLATLFADEAIAAAPQDLAERIVAATARLRPRPTWRARLDQAGRISAPHWPATVTGQPAARAWLLLALTLLLAAGVVVAGAYLLDRRPILRGVFVPAGSLPTPATVAISRPDGQILIFGGTATATHGLGSLSGTPESIFLYDPAAGTSRVIGNTPTSVSYAVPLADGRVLAIALDVPEGGGPGSSGFSRAALVDPATGTVTQLGFLGPHLVGAGVRLADGRVLLVGSADGTTDANVFDPATGTFAATGSTTRPMMQPTATLLADGRVLVVGDREPVAELYDPATGTFSQTGPMSGPHEAFTATLLLDGRVLVAGGWATNGTVVDGTFFASEPARLGTGAEIYDHATGQFSQVGPMVAPRVYHFAVALQDGRVLIGGGTSAADADPGSGGSVEPAPLVAELFDPATGGFLSTGTLSTPRFGAAAVRLADGRILVIGSVMPSGISFSPDFLTGTSLEVYE